MHTRNPADRPSGEPRPRPGPLGHGLVPAPDRPDDLVHQLYRAHALTLVRLAVLLLGDRPSAEDVVQDAFMGQHRTLPGLGHRDKPLAYLRPAVVSGSRSLLRARTRGTRRQVPHEPPVWSAES